MIDYVVLDVKNFGKPMVQMHHDGTKKLDNPGVLFYATDNFAPTYFRGRAAAVRAVTASVAYRGDAEADYSIVTRADYDQIIETRGRGRRKGSKRDKT